ncbi:hypothetical protein E6H33_09950 [Candidatus Bathyarchaeota archaeon]|nr:MAG: hypothetical protein E6H33_09950 [Candidatus Bathyarchaeota archaeon]
MSEIDSAIAVGGTLLGAVVAYYFEERRFSKQKRLEISLQPLEERRVALKEVYLALVNCFWALARNFGGTTEEKFVQNVVPPLEQLEITIARNQIWLSSAQPRILAALGKFRLTAFAIRFGMQESGVPEQSRPPPGFMDVPWLDFENSYKDAVLAIAEALGVSIMEKGLEELIGQPPPRVET